MSFEKNRIFWIFPFLVNTHAHAHTKHMLITSDHKFNLSQLSTWHHFLSCGAYPSVNKMGIHFHSNRECDSDQLQWLFVGTQVYRYQNPKWRLITLKKKKESSEVGLYVWERIPGNGKWSYWPLAWCHLQLLGHIYIANANNVMYVSCEQGRPVLLVPGGSDSWGCTRRCCGAGSCGMRWCGSLELHRKRGEKR